jgi:Polyprenyl synthetase
MFTSFQDYVGARRPGLDAAFGEQISALLGTVPLKQKTALFGTLRAGKKIRGCLSCLVNDALGGMPEGAIPGALAIELIQAATLIHDDFVDQDTTRGKRPAAWTLEGARRAVLIGDVIFATAIQMMSAAGADEGLAVSRAIAQVSRGALSEPLDAPALASEIESGGVKGGLYEKIIRLKTGILFGTACRLGALAAKAGGQIGEACFRYGVRIGEAYQVADDLEDLERYLIRRAIQPGEMAALAPALLFFAESARPLILGFLKGKGAVLGGAAVEAFGAASAVMKEEIELRLRAAASEIDGNFPENEYRPLLIKAPWELIRMFNGLGAADPSGR